MRRYAIALICLNIIFSFNTVTAQESHYRDFQAREIKSLSKQQMEGYLEGRGMGMALAAELNDYPGPKHVLELRDSLKINDKQEKEIKEIYDAMHEEAVKLGKSVVEKEKELDQLFASGKITDNSLAFLTSEISDLKGQLRFAHLIAHLKTREVLTLSQIETYKKLRGYEKMFMPPHHRHGKHN